MASKPANPIPSSILGTSERSRSPIQLGTKPNAIVEGDSKLIGQGGALSSAAVFVEEVSPGIELAFSQLSSATAIVAVEIQVLSRLDVALVKVLLEGDIRLLRSSWLLACPDWYRIERRQDLEKREERGESPLLTQEEAAKLVSRGDRGAGAFTYGWLSPGNPDPLGTRLAALRSALAHLPHIEGLFWDFASLYQLPRTEVENEAFGRSLPAMNQLYASAVGTTVLQLKEMPKTPEEYLGELCLFGVDDTISKATVEKALSRFGKVVSCKLDGPLRQTHNAVVTRFASHSEALAAKAGGAMIGVYAGADTLYNEHPYDERGWVESSGIHTHAE